MDIAKAIGLPALLGQTAEECAELGKACLKLQRILMGTNPTPVTEEEALASILEECTDLRNCLLVLDKADIPTTDNNLRREKMARWERRIKNPLAEDDPGFIPGLVTEV